MNYYVLLLIKVPESEQFIEVGLHYELPFHPNLTDEIHVASYPCEIKEIYYDLDNLRYITMRVQATDNVLWFPPETTSEEIHDCLSNEWKALKRWTKSNYKTIILNDYSNHPEKEFNNGTR